MFTFPFTFIAAVVEAFNITNYTYNANSKSVATEDTAPQDVLFSNDGTKMFIVGAVADKIFQYTLSTAWDVTTASKDAAELDTSTEDPTMTGGVFSADGLKLFLSGTTNDTLYEYTLSSAFSLTGATYSGNSKSIAAQETNVQTLDFGDDGNKLYIFGATNDTVYEYDLGVAYSLSGSMLLNTSYIPPITDWAANKLGTGMRIIKNGTVLLLMGRTVGRIFQYDLSTPWDVSTASYTASNFISVLGQDTLPTGMFYSESADKLFVTGQDTDSVYEYDTV